VFVFSQKVAVLLVLLHAASYIKMSSFETLGVEPELIQAVEDEGWM
jgi:hypothetical protein